MVEICRKLKCSRYLSPPGAKEYLSKDRSAFDEAGIGIVMQKYEHPRYNQGGLPFVSHLSIVDLLLNEGAKSLEIIRSGRGAPTELEA